MQRQSGYAGLVALLVGTAGMMEGDANAGDRSKYAIGTYEALGRIEIDRSAGDGRSFDRYGTVVAADDDTLVVGVPDDELGYGRAGSAYVYERDAAGAWKLVEKLVAPTDSPASAFGAAAAVDGDAIVIGAPNADGHGAAYVFLRNDDGWEALATLPLDATVDGMRFGASVAIDGDAIVVGAPDEAVGPVPRAGTVRVYGRSTLEYDDTIASTAPEADAAFGATLALSGDDLLVGEPLRDDGKAVDAGRATVYKRDAAGFALAATLDAGSLAAGDRYGTAIALDGDVAVVAAPGNDDIVVDGGAVHVFRRDANGWGATPAQRITRPNVAAGDALGAVAISADRLAIGAASVGVSGVVDHGEVRVYEDGATGYTEIEALTPPAAPAPGWALGASVAFSGVDVIAGSPGAPAYAGRQAQGEVKVYTFAGKDVAATARLDSGAGRAGARFASRVAVDGTFALLSVPGEQIGDVGSITTYERGVDRYVARQAFAGSAPDGLFGFAIGVSGNAAVATEPFPVEGADRYAVTLLEKAAGVWAVDERIVLLGPTGAFGGASASLAGDRLAIGAPDAADGRGYVRMIERIAGDWTSTALVEGPLDAGPSFGESVAIEGDRLLVGAPRANGNRGRVLAYRRVALDTWVPDGELAPNDPLPDAFFGVALALDGNRALVGEPFRENALGQPQGRATLFERKAPNWKVVREWTTPATLASGGFEHLGFAVALDGTRAVIGAPDFVIDGDPKGLVFVYHGDDGKWDALPAEMFEGEGAPDRYGASVALARGALVVGAPGASATSPFANPGEGVVYAYLADARAEAELAVTIDDGRTQIGPGAAVVTWRAIVTNEGADVADPFTVTLSSDRALDLTSFVCSVSDAAARCTYSAVGENTFDVTDLGPGEQVMVDMTATVGGGAGSTIVVQATVDPATNIDTDPTDDVARDTDTFVGDPLFSNGFEG